MSKEEEVIFVASDHAGFSVKEKVVSYLESKSYDINDLGPNKLNPNDDYPDYALKVANKVKKGKSLGILICSTGIGMCITSNKIKGVRAAAVYDKKTAKLSRLHNNTNILCLPGNNLSFDKIKKILDIWLNTEFSEAPRHLRRLKKIELIENNILKS